MASRGKRARPNPEASQSKSQRHTKRRRAARIRMAELQETANDTPEQNDVQYMGTQPRIQQSTETSRAKSFPSPTSQFIDLTLSDEVEEGFPALPSNPKPLEYQAKEQSRSRYPLRSKTPGNTRERSLNPPHMASTGPLARVPETQEQKRSDHFKPAGQRFPEKPINQNEGKGKATSSQKPLALAHRFSKRQLKSEQCEQRARNAEREATGGKRTMARSPTDTWGSSTSTGIMFTISEAIAAIARPQLANTIAYDLPTGAYISYPVKRSYHLGAMGRYTCRTIHRPSSNRPSGVVKHSSRFDRPRSNYTNAHICST